MILKVIFFSVTSIFPYLQSYGNILIFPTLSSLILAIPAVLCDFSCNFGDKPLLLHREKLLGQVVGFLFGYHVSRLSP